MLVHRFKRIVLPFFVLGLLIFPMLNNMRALAEWVGEGREERVAETSEDKETGEAKSMKSLMIWEGRLGRVTSI